jgi:hypothetical protein
MSVRYGGDSMRGNFEQKRRYYQSIIIKFKRATAAVVLCFLLVVLFVLLASCGKRGIDIVNIDTSEDSGTSDNVTETDNSSGIDHDAEEVDGIAIYGPDDLAKIGVDAKYPLDGDYVLVADIDLSGRKWKPIGGTGAASGAYSGAGVFSGSFDGRGHVISGLTIDATTSSSHSNWGLFGTLGGKNARFECSVKNIVFKDVSITVIAGGSVAVGTLAGQANGCVYIDGITILSGSVSVLNAGGGDILGAGGLIGQFRTNDIGNSNITVRNIFTNIDVYGEPSGYAIYVGGFAGRIRAGNLGEISNVLVIGSATSSSGSGFAIAGGDSSANTTKRIYYLPTSGDSGFYGRAVSSDRLASGSITMGESWHVEAGMHPIPISAYNSREFSILDLIRPIYANGEDAYHVKNDIKLTTEVGSHKITWKSSDESVVKISGNKAAVTRPDVGYKDVILTATAANGDVREYKIRVISGVTGRFTNTSAKVGDKLTVAGYPEGTVLTWTITNSQTGQKRRALSDTSGEYTVTKDDIECFATVSAEGFDDISKYISSLPVIYIDSSASYSSINKAKYSEATMRIQGNGAFENEEYDGKIYIKLRGNSTAGLPKRPFNIKLDKRTNLFDMGEGKRWCLLANYLDRSNLRNQLAFDLGNAIGLPKIESVWCVLIYNGEYRGLYQLTEKITIDTERVNITDWDEIAEDIARAIGNEKLLSNKDIADIEDKLQQDLSWITTGVWNGYKISDYIDTSNFDITGGYLLELDEYYDEVSKFTTSRGVPMMIKEPEFVFSNEAMFNYIKNYIQSMEDAIYSPDGYNSSGMYYTDYMDMDSFIGFWYLNVVLKNVETFYKSCYMYLDKDGVLTFGPVWDYDWCSGNTVNMGGASTAYDSWRSGESQDREYWYRALYDDPYFMLRLYDAYKKYRSTLDDMIASIDTYKRYLSAAANADNKLWGYWRSADDEVASLKSWLKSRASWLDKQLKTPEKFIESIGVYKKSGDIDITSVNVRSGRVTVKATAKVNINSIAFRFNGSYIVTADVENGAATVTVNISDIPDDGASAYCVEALGRDILGEYIVYRKPSWEGASPMYVSDYEYFND